MLRIAGLSMKSNSVSRFGATGFALAFAAAGAGCSTDFRRLEQPAVGLNEGPRPSESIRRGVGAPTGAEQAWKDSGPRAPLQPPSAQALPPLPAPSTAGPNTAGPNTAGLSKPFDRPKAAVAATPVGGSKISTAGSVDVQPGDSLFSIAKRHNVSIAALMEVNQLKSPNLKPGQKLALPATAGRRPAVRTETKVASAGGALPAVAPVVTVAAPATPAAAPAPLTPQPSLRPIATAPAGAPTGEWGGSYTVKSGDSLYNVARSYKVPLAELQRVNGIADPTKVRPGAVLKVPGSAVAEPAETPRVVVASAPAAAAAGTVTSPKIINAQPAAVTPSAATIAPPVAAPVTPSAPAVEKAPVVTTAAPTVGAAAVGAKFRWPVQGQVLSSFGKRPDGTQNDGIDIAVPAGTDVQAASAGTVAYAGSELKGYGNLILVRHDNGWVSAYAHASEILVKRGDAVTRGQVIAKSGQTGTVSQPQLHFELRQGSKPVDPAPHLEKK